MSCSIGKASSESFLNDAQSLENGPMDTSESQTETQVEDALSSPCFYTDAAAYWEKVPATVNGMLGGFAKISATDLSGSETFLRSIFKLKNPPGHSRVADCGAGIGRISKNVLQRHFGTVDLVEQCQAFLDKAKVQFKGSKKAGNFICTGLQDFTPPSNTYDVVWVQWVSGHLTDSDFVSFLRRIGKGLKLNGVVVLKENVSSLSKVELDEDDSSVTRPLSHILKIIDNAGFRVLKNVQQRNFPKALFEVRMLCMKPR